MVSPSYRQAGLGAVVGGVLWAVTPLRQPVLGAGSTPDEGVAVFRGYNLLLLLIAVLLTLALLCLRTRGGGSKLFATGWWTVLAGHVLLFLGSLPAVLFGGASRDLVRNGQDLAFLGAMVAAAGALLVGLHLRRRGLTVAAWLFLLTLPLGALGTTALSALRVPEDYLGLPLTLLYGGAWIATGWSFLDQRHGPTTDALAPGPR